jgi:thymidylate kinase
MYKYIIIEWIHGSWKRTIALEFNKRLQELWYNSEYLHFPDEENILWKAIRKILTDQDLYKKREVLWLLYAAFSNMFHIKNKNNNKIFILERHSITTWTIFQEDIPQNIRKEIHKYWLSELQEKWIMVYLQVDKNIALKRSIQRNKKLYEKWWVWKDKAWDKFIKDKFLELASKYDNYLRVRVEKLWIKTTTVYNESSIENCVNEIIWNLNIEKKQ